MGVSQPSLTKYTPQYMQAYGFDETYQQPTVELIGFDSANSVLRRVTVDASGNLNFSGGASLPTAPKTGQAKIAVTGTAVQLAANALTQGVIISAKTGNAAAITIGASSVTNTVDGTGNGLILAAGASISYAGSNTNQIWINGQNGDVISFIGS